MGEEKRDGARTWFVEGRREAEFVWKQDQHLIPSFVSNLMTNASLTPHRGRTQLGRLDTGFLRYRRYSGFSAGF